VGLDRVVDDVCLRTVLALAGLVTRGAVGLLDLDARARLGLVELRDDLVEAGLRDGVGVEVDDAAAAVGAPALHGITGATTACREDDRGDGGESGCGEAPARGEPGSARHRGAFRCGPPRHRMCRGGY